MAAQEHTGSAPGAAREDPAGSGCGGAPREDQRAPGYLGAGGLQVAHPLPGTRHCRPLGSAPPRTTAQTDTKEGQGGAHAHHQEDPGRGHALESAVDGPVRRVGCRLGGVVQRAGRCRRQDSHQTRPRWDRTIRMGSRHRPLSRWTPRWHSLAHQRPTNGGPVDRRHEAPSLRCGKHHSPAIGTSVARPNLPERRMPHADGTNSSSMDKDGPTRHPMRRSRAKLPGQPAPWRRRHLSPKTVNKPVHKGRNAHLRPISASRFSTLIESSPGTAVRAHRPHFSTRPPQKEKLDRGLTKRYLIDT